MPCTPFQLPGGGWGLACGPRRPEVKCQEPGCTNPSRALCDYPTATGTCDRRLCALHRHTVGPDRDYCGPHYRASQAGK